MSYQLQLERLRMEKKMTQQDVADALHLSTAIISKFETNVKTMNLPRACTIADLFGVTLDELAGRDIGKEVIKNE